MNPDDKFRGKKNFHERKAERIKAAGLPSDHQKPKAPEVKSSPANTVTVSIPRNYASGGVIYPNSGTNYFMDAMNKVISGYSFTLSGTMFGSSEPDVRFSGKEFAASSVKGVRSFRIDDLGRLTGVTFKKVWKPGENDSECLAEKKHAEGKFPDCKCGFYGYYEGSNDYHNEGMVSAVVEGYGGDAVIGTHGFRVTKARIIALTINDNVPAAVARLVRRAYADVPMFDTFARMVSEFPPDYELDEKPLPSLDDPDFWTRDV